MNFVRSGLLLLLLGVGITLILLSRCVEKPVPAPPGPDTASSRPASRPSAREGPSRPVPGARASRPERAPSPEGARKLLPPSRKNFFLAGKVVDGRGLPVEGARVEPLERPPANFSGGGILPLFMKAQRALLEEKAGIEEWDPFELSEKAARRVFRLFVPAGPLEPHALSGPGGVFRLGPLPKGRVWLRARKGGLATRGPVPARPGEHPLLVLLPAASLQVTVLDPKGKPLPRCLVRLADRSAFQQYNQGGMGTSALSYLEGKTGRNGTFTFLGLPPPGPYLALALPEGKAPASSRPRFLSPGRLQKITLQVHRGGSLLLRVRDPRKNPLARVKVRLFPTGIPLVLVNALGPIRGATGPGGEVSFQDLTPGEWVAKAHARGFEPGTATFQVREGKTARLKITLSPGATLSGFVKNEDGAPIANALVGFSLNLQGLSLSTFMDPLLLLDPRTATRTNAGGEFSLAGLPRRPCALTAWAPGYACSVKNGIRPGGKRKVTLVLSRMGAVEGRVVGPSGKPVSRFTAEAWREGMVGMRRFLASGKFSPGDGRFRLEGIPPGPFLLDVRAEGLAPKEIPDLEVESGSTLKLTLPIQLALPALVEGKVVDREGSPVPGALVRLVPYGKSLVRVPGFSRPAAATRSGPRGEFRLEDLPAGKWRLEADAGPRGLAEQAEPVETKEGEPVRDLLLVLQPLASLEGRVYAPDGGPGKHTAVLLQRIQAGGFLQKWARTDERGRFFVPGLPPGTWQLITMGSGFMRNAFLVQDELRKRGKFDLKGFMDQSRIGRIHLEPGRKGTIILGTPARASGVLEGLVTRGGKPLAGALVTLVPMDEKKGEKAASPRMSATGKDGRFNLENIPGGKYTVVVLSRTVGGTRVEKTVLIRNGETSTIRVAFGSGTVRGKLVPRERCGGLGGKFVILRREGQGSTMGTAVTDAEGRFRFDSLPPGIYRIYTRPFLKPVPGEPVGRSEAFPVREGSGTLEVQVPVQPSAAIQGSLEPGGAKGILVVARVEGWPTPFQAETGEAGLFKIGGLPPGKTHLLASAGKKKASLEILTSPGETTRVVLHLE